MDNQYLDENGTLKYFEGERVSNPFNVRFGNVHGTIHLGTPSPPGWGGRCTFVPHYSPPPLSGRCTQVHV